jgi:hypothetical protein
MLDAKSFELSSKIKVVQKGKRHSGTRQQIM